MIHLTEEQRKQITIPEVEELQSLGYVFHCENGQAIGYYKEEKSKKRKV